MNNITLKLFIEHTKGQQENNGRTFEPLLKKEA